MNTFLAIMACASPFIILGVMFLLGYLFLRSKPSTPLLDEQENFQPVRSLWPYWRHGYHTPQNQVCLHELMEPYYETDDVLIKRCPNCGHTEPSIKEQL